MTARIEVSRQKGRFKGRFRFDGRLGKPVGKPRVLSGQCSSVLAALSRFGPASGKHPRGHQFCVGRAIIEATASGQQKDMTYCSSFTPIRRCHLTDRLIQQLTHLISRRARPPLPAVPDNTVPYPAFYVLRHPIDCLTTLVNDFVVARCAVPRTADSP